jgi:hypothetical protein
MNKGNENFIGCFRYEGKLVEEGLIEARTASRALSGIDTALHYFLAQEEPLLGTFDLPLPVQIRKGSWETWIPHTIQDTDEILFPELTHGLPVSLDGIVTCGNEMSNTIGFWYKNHVLTCFPTSRNIVRFKKHLFLKCRIHGEITRLDKNGRPLEKRPKIRFERLETLSNEEQFAINLKDQNEDV